MQVEAIAGQPFGVGRITFDLPDDMLPEPLGAEGIGLSERNGRIFYPAVDSPAFGKVIKRFLDSNTPLTTGGPVREEVGGLLRGLLDRPPRTTVYFLFRGNEPLQVTLQLRKPVELTIVPPSRRPAESARPHPPGQPHRRSPLAGTLVDAVCQDAGSAAVRSQIIRRCWKTT